MSSSQDCWDTSQNFSQAPGVRPETVGPTLQVGAITALNTTASASWQEIMVLQPRPLEELLPRLLPQDLAVQEPVAPPLYISGYFQTHSYSSFTALTDPVAMLQCFP